MMNKRTLLSLLSSVALLSACQGSQNAEPPLAGARMGGAFSLLNQDGQRVTDKDFAGKYRLIYFGYTYCPDVCPVDVQRLMQGFAMLEKNDPARARIIQPIFVTVDPQRDTPAVLKQFVRAFHPRLLGLTGSPAEISTVAARYAVVFQKAPGADKVNYLVDHSRTAVLYGPTGDPITLVPQDGTPAQIAETLAKWAK